MNDRELLEPVEVVGYLYAVCGDLLLDHQKPNLPNEPLMTVAQHKRLMAAQEPDIEQIMAKAKELFGWCAGLGGFDDAVRELVAFTAGHRFAPSLPAAPEVKP